ncbi:ankyrin repeat domain-containing protein [Endozoicomonas sp. 8E]|uniref:ankyrin repeat domain-containing protein n=1 Tax=Endozoicomonas sp. 8E TaxID=3035692 RepID=UPI00293937CF|nr:ankyrin repeat domain-containing protein [Endozoicomonas sp. 8E]WOG30284.1 ankyrin repeat domain-containing protein [Endozoicomonas sp. 8E]
MTNPEVATGEYLEWQLPVNQQSDSSISVRARSVSVATKTQGTRTQSFTGEVTIFGQIDQPFIVCAQGLNAQGFTYEASAVVPLPFSNSDKSTHLYVLRLSEQTGRIAVKESQPCPESFNHPYPFTSGQYLRSKKPFLVVNGRVEKTHDTQNAGAIPPAGMPIKPVLFQSPSGGGYDTDDDNDFKRPPFMPVPDKMMVDLILLPTLSLPANWRDYLPFVGVYHWLTNTQPEGVTIVVRFGDSPPLTFRISLAESRELAVKLLNTRELLHWLAPRLSGREHLIQRLLELTTDSDERPCPLSEDILKSLRKQLAIVLELPDTEFSLEFEYSELERTFKRQTRTQTPPENVQLGNAQSTSSQNPAVNKGNKQRYSGRLTHNNEKKQNQPEQNYPEPDNKRTDYTHNAFSGDDEYYTVILHQTEYHVSKRQVLANLDRPASEAGLRLSCMDCEQSGFLLQEVLPHAQRHWITCDQCQQFRPIAGTLDARQVMLKIHTQSQCTRYRGQVPGTPSMDNTLTLFRFMIRFGTEETLLDLLQQFDLPIVAEDLNQTDRNHRTVLHDLAQYTSPAVIRSFLQRFKHWVTAELIQLPDNYGWTSAHYLFQYQSEQDIMETIQSNGKMITWELQARQNRRGSTPLHILYHRNFVRAVEGVFQRLQNQTGRPVSQYLAMQNFSGANLLHILFASCSTPLIYYFIDQNYSLMTDAMLVAEAHNGETPLHILFGQGSSATIERIIEGCRIYLDSKVLGKKRAIDGYTPLHLLFARGNNSLTKAFLGRVYFDYLIGLTTNHAGVSVAQMLLQHTSPAAASSWLLANLEHKHEQLLKTLLESNPELSWDELFQQARLLQVRSHRLDWLKEEREKSITEKSIVTVASAENQLHEIARNNSPEDIAAIFERNAETITPAMLSKANSAGFTPFHILVDRGISAGTIFSWLLHGLSDAVANELLDIDLFGALGWRHIYDYARVSSYLEKDLKLKQVLGLLEPIFNQKPTSSEMASSPSTQEFSDAVAHMECPICMEAMAENVAATPCCGQLFHKDCITSWVKGKNQCSHCRKSISANQLTTIRLPEIFVTKVFDVQPKVKPEEKNSSPDGAKLPHFATGQGHTESVQAEILSDSDRIKHLLDLHSAVRTGNTQLIKKVLDFDPSLAKEKNILGETALHKAAFEGHTVVIRTLLDFDRSLAKEKDNDGKTALHNAAFCGHTVAIQTLLDFDRSMAKEKDKYGKTALHTAADWGHPEVIQKLLNFDRSLAKEKDKYGRTALDYAMQLVCTDCKKLLEDYGAQSSGSLQQ